MPWRCFFESPSLQGGTRTPGCVIRRRTSRTTAIHAAGIFNTGVQRAGIGSPNYHIDITNMVEDHYGFYQFLAGEASLWTCFEIIHLARREYTAGWVDREKPLAPGVFTRG